MSKWRHFFTPSFVMRQRGLRCRNKARPKKRFYYRQEKNFLKYCCFRKNALCVFADRDPGGAGIPRLIAAARKFCDKQNKQYKIASTPFTRSQNQKGKFVYADTKLKNKLSEPLCGARGFNRLFLLRSRRRFRVIGAAGKHGALQKCEYSGQR